MDPNGYFRIRLYVVKKKDIQKIFPYKGYKLFRKFIDRLIDQGRNNFNQPLLVNNLLEIVADIKIPVQSKKYSDVKQGIVDIRFIKNIMENGKIYLYNPSITLSKDYLKEPEKYHTL